MTFHRFNLFQLTIIMTLTRDGKSECRHSRNQRTEWTGMGEFNSDTITSITAGRNPSEEME